MVLEHIIATVCSFSLFLILHFFISLTEHCLTLNFLRTQGSLSICTPLYSVTTTLFLSIPSFAKKKNGWGLGGMSFSFGFSLGFFWQDGFLWGTSEIYNYVWGGIRICSTPKILNNYPFTCCQKSLLENITWSHSVDCPHLLFSLLFCLLT